MRGRTLRILCLHGFRSSGAQLQSQMRALLTGLEPSVEFIYPNAPPLASGGNAWWNATPIDGAEPSARRYEGWTETRAWATAYFAENQPIDGVFGFSQGAALAALLVGLRAPPLRFAFALLVSGFVSKDPAHAALYDAHANFELPSLHLIGLADRIVPPVASHVLAARFQSPQIVEHQGGHVIAASSEVRGALSAFLSEAQAAQARSDPR